MSDAISVEQLKFGYDHNLIVDIDRFALEAGRSVAVVGPSGCGKTSLLHLLSGLLTPNSGRIEVLGQNFSDLQGRRMDRFRGASMGLVLQRFHLFRSLSVRENLRLAAKLARVATTDGRIDQLLDSLGIAAVAHQKPQTLSQGQAQRAAIARALVHQPKLVMADEPTSALDDANAEEVINLLKPAVAESGAALLVVTHDQRIRGALDSDFSLGAPS